MPYPRFAGGESYMGSDGEAVLFKFQNAEGAPVEIEVMREHMAALVSLTLAASTALGEQRPETRPLPETEPHQAALANVSEIRVKRSGPTGVWIYLRVGAVDVSIPLLDTTSAAALGQALIREAGR